MAQSKPIKLVAINPMFGHNGFHHFTDQYDIVEDKTGLVVRRGAPFRIDFRFDGDLDDYDLLTVVIASEDYGDERLQNQWTVKESPKKLSMDESNLSPLQIFRIVQNADRRTISVVFFSRPDAVVSKYNLTGVSIWRSRNEYFSTDICFPIYLIFNPMHPEDAVYMPNEAERKEYVLQDQGRVYFGTSRKIGSRPWFFAQFENPILPCALLLLAKSDLQWQQWADPVQVARALSALVNSNDDDGLLVGNWSGQYSDGVAPTQWKGSLKIIKQYFETQEPVSYGQCWVFSGCLTSLARSLGIPARSVTNFDSAHDTDASLTIDSHFDEEFSPKGDMNGDSIWNFHVWNDLWMSRRDLGSGGEFDGWQAVDATPQEASDEIYRTGPCPVEAIRRGRVDVAYDASFVFAEVNACIKHWVWENKQKREIFSDPRKVGKFISTKAVGSDERLDVTSLYKFDEGSPEEAEAFANAQSLLNIGDRRNDVGQEKNFKIQIQSSTDCCVFGCDVQLGVEIQSIDSSRAIHELQFAAVVNVKKYNGQILAVLRNHRDTIKLKSQSSHRIPLDITAAEYAQICGEDEIGFEVIATVSDKGGAEVVEQSIINVDRPEVEIEVIGDVVQNRDFRLRCKFVNTLPMRLTSCRFSVDGPGLRGETKVWKVQDLEPQQQCGCSLTLNAARTGNRMFIVSFDSAELKGVCAEQPVIVMPE